MEKKLIVLDLDETLIYSTEKPLDRDPDFQGGYYFTYRRPYLTEFLDFCFQHFEVAVWTSSGIDYAEIIVKNILLDSQKLAFLWASERGTHTYDPELMESFLGKRAKKIKKAGFNLEKVIVVDDSPEKWTDNYGNLVAVKPYYGEKDDDELKLLPKYLTKLAEVENVRKVEKRGWRHLI